MSFIFRISRSANLAFAAFFLAIALGIAAEKAPEGSDKGPVAQFSPEGAVFAESVNVRIKAPSGAVHYTLDGSEPSAKSPVYSKELSLAATTLVRARIFDGGKPLGPVVSQTFTIVARELENFTSNLPLVIINTFGREIERENRIGTSVRFIAVKDGRSILLGPANFEGRGEINLRGNTSLRYLKRSFSLKTRDESGQSRSVPILGLPSDNDWVLYAPYPDKTLIRDVLAYDLSRQVGRYASRTKFVEVFLNQVGGKLTRRHHMGVYVLEEKIKRGADRVKLQKLGPNDNTEPNITGGYIFKKDHWDTHDNVEPTVEGRPNGFGGSSRRYGYPTGPGGFPADPAGFLPPEGGEQEERLGTRFQPDRLPLPPPGEGQIGGPEIRRRRAMSTATIQRGDEEAFRTGQGNEFFYVEPKQEEITPGQKNWLQRHLNEFEQALYGPDFRDPKKGYAAYIDVDSFIDHHLLVEVTKNIDGFRFSTFFQKDRGQKIRMEPIWDWNLSMGNCNGKQGWLPEYWYWPQLDDNQYSWFRRLFEDPDFGQRYVDRWTQLRHTVFSTSNIVSKIDGFVAELGEARVRNFQRWPILNRMIWPNKFIGKTYEDEINFLKDFMQKRLTWIDAQFAASPEIELKEGTLTLNAKRGTVYYTLDGSDPRKPGGSISDKAVRYSSPIKQPNSGRLFARAFQDNRWSAPIRQ